MATLRVLNGGGDRRITWSPERLLRGEPEAEAVVRQAERIFARASAARWPSASAPGRRRSGWRRSTRWPRTPC